MENSNGSVREYPLIFKVKDLVYNFHIDLWGTRFTWSILFSRRFKNVSINEQILNGNRQGGPFTFLKSQYKNTLVHVCPTLCDLPG